MLGTRTLRSLAQILELLQDGGLTVLLLEKYKLSDPTVWNSRRHPVQRLGNLVELLDAGAEPNVLALLDEIVQVSSDFRSRVSPRARYDERFVDLKRCLELDGYLIQGSRLVPVDPFIVGNRPVEDDLTRELAESGLANSNHIAKKLHDSAESFQSSQPNYNASLNDARVALETLAVDIADARLSSHPGSVDRSRWGSVVAYLRNIGFITEQEEPGLVGVYGFVSPGSHHPLGLSEDEFARLGRGFIAGMCWFLVKRYRAV